MSNDVAYIGRCSHGEVVAVASTPEDKELMTEEMGEFLESGWLVQIISENNPAPVKVSCFACAQEKDPAA